MKRKNNQQLLCGPPSQPTSLAGRKTAAWHSTCVRPSAKPSEGSCYPKRGGSKHKPKEGAKQGRHIVEKGDEKKACYISNLMRTHSQTHMFTKGDLPHPEAREAFERIKFWRMYIKKKKMTTFYIILIKRSF